MRFATQALPNTSFFIAALRLCAMTASAHQAALAPNWAEPAGQIGFQHGMNFLALAAARAQPPDHLVAGLLLVGYHAEQFVGAFGSERLGRKRQARFIAERQLAQRFADRQEAVIRPLFAVSGPVGNVTNLRPFLVRLVRLAIEHADQRLPFALRG